MASPIAAGAFKITSSQPPPIAYGAKPTAPAWLAYDGKVLRFYAYYKEGVHDSKAEHWRVRRLAFHYHLEDGSLAALEPREENSGLPQGQVLRRHRAIHPDGRKVDWRDLAIGSVLALYGRAYHIVGVDAATRAFLTKEFVRVPPNLEYPEGPHDVATRESAAEEARIRSRPGMSDIHFLRANKAGYNRFLLLDRKARPRRRRRGPARGEGGDCGFGGRQHVWGPYRSILMLRRPPLGCRTRTARNPPLHLSVFTHTNMHANRRRRHPTHAQVLRFYCCWDEPSALTSDKLPFILHYYLVDDTMEVAEVHPRNDGRDPFPLLVSRARLPKGGHSPSAGFRRTSKLSFYSWTDLRIGSFVSVYGREMLLFDCDDFTRAWYKEYLQLEDGELAPLEVEFRRRPRAPPIGMPPNELGIGSDEDAMANAARLLPKQPVKSYNEFLANDGKVRRCTRARRMSEGGCQACVGGLLYKRVHGGHWSGAGWRMGADGRRSSAGGCTRAQRPLTDAPPSPSARTPGAALRRPHGGGHGLPADEPDRRGPPLRGLLLPGRRRHPGLRAAGAQLGHPGR